MKKIHRLFMVLLMPLLALSITANAAKYTEGDQYTKVSETASTNVEVREYFSVYCGHCFQFEPIMHDIKEQLPDNVKFERNHVDFLGGVSPTIQQMITKSIAIAEQLENSDKYIGAIFNYIHVQRATITTEKDLRNIFVLNGADGEQFDKLSKSFSVNAHAKAMKKHQDVMSQKRALTGVPTVIVNGKYRVNSGALDKSNPKEDYKNLINYLLTIK
ncbi:thiol:disulfide interchange protein DsbA/DsbL [Colwellia sp. 1_MG-2023]|uniref:thiol:disulfide interchange protein DsbA/DsbL n=1 Tax=unclassified Colwellia TaxID=196834 RepID=UPI001C0A47CB|nr:MULTISPECIES: thiol:disulfide interchange protein DsbA/DsbL [unclassified Colwellia]MBU2923788.1 thiol:disulfide interchange protein DsbA/DsbL [Colwellia sp. C2M11]MDO6654041.1 thiol:disulfide interchange protein DsbA/DsbL [Colwellia sp. 3_MG-2023]MDO6666992.1 thiol:disulfide interchange protein DsbA/DsbL [Colwellia sp. 2_MG-2023]MDO6691397.1 thiol:disulfide interchange protein DsbA/DsbL [Colwellia sp. 1_MG-2023]